MIVVLGRNGQLARALAAAVTESGGQVRSFGRDGLDSKSFPETLRQVRDLNPTLLLNAAAYTGVDRAESEPDLARWANAEIPGQCARVARELGIPFVHFSTDYVYAGDGQEARDETSTVAPINLYGRTKLEGDQAVQREIEQGLQAWILRTSWVFDREGANFVNTMLRLARERRDVRVVADQWGSPTYAPDLAHWALELVEITAPSGVYHACNSGVTSWAEFASEIFRVAQSAKLLTSPTPTVTPITTAGYPTPAARPLNSRLSTKKLTSALGHPLRSWKEALAECLAGTNPRSV